jgi:hypothetical protein
MDMGATALIDDIISASFSIVLIDSTVADTCKSNILLPAANTKSGNVRESTTLTYKIPLNDDTNADPFVIEALAVTGTIPTCELQTIVQYWDEYGCDYENMDPAMMSTAAGECNGAWYDWFDPIAMFDVSSMSISW